MDVAGLEAILDVPGAILLALPPESPVAFWDAVDIALDRIRKAARTGLHQQTGAHLCTVGFGQGAVPQPFDDFAGSRGLAERAFCGDRSRLDANGLHIGIERCGPAGP